MMPSFLLEEGSRRHFVTKKFDRQGNRKRHIQKLTGIAHVDYKKPGSFSYAELFGVARQLRLPAEDAEHIMRLMIFNIIARNHDDHAKNFAFMIDLIVEAKLAGIHGLPASEQLRITFCLDTVISSWSC